MDLINFAHSSNEITDNWFDRMMDGSHWSSGGGFVMMWVFFLLILAAGIWIMVNVSKHSKSSDSQKDKPLDVAKRRYAAGEINKKQFEEMKKNLGER